jgi:aromatic-L-amino-acid decarboxylase
MDNINATGKVFISHTSLNNKFTIRYVVSGIRTTEDHVLQFWNLISNEYLRIKKGG